MCDDTPPAKAKAVGHTSAVLRRDQVTDLRKQASPWRQIAARMHLGVGTLRRVLKDLIRSAEGCIVKYPCTAERYFWRVTTTPQAFPPLLGSALDFMVGGRGLEPRTSCL